MVNEGVSIIKSLYFRLKPISILLLLVYVLLGTSQNSKSQIKEAILYKKAPSTHESAYAKAHSSKSKSGEAYGGVVISMRGHNPENNWMKEPQYPYTIKNGDSLWSIAQSFYGDGRKSQLIIADNSMELGSVLVPGDKLVLKPH